MTNFQSPGPMFFGPPRTLAPFVTARVIKMSPCSHRHQTYTIKDGWSCKDCGEPIEV